MQEGELGWFGQSGERLLFCFHSELDLLPPPSGKDSLVEDKPADSSDQGPNADPIKALETLFEDPQGRYDFGTLLHKSGMRPGELNQTIWQAVWQGRISNDGFIALRRGLAQRFRLTEISGLGQSSRTRPRTRKRHISFGRWKAARPYAGNWYRVSYSEPTDDLLEAAEQKKEQVRLLLDRYAILFREILLREMPALRWADIFRTLRLMEFSGEVLAGAFFNGIPGLQFVSPAGLHLLKQQMPSDAVFWMNAADPASLCGAGLSAFKNMVPRRLGSNHLVYHDDRLVLVSERRGRKLTFHVPPDAAHVQRYMAVLHHLMNRRFDPLRYVEVQIINDRAAADSPYRIVLEQAFDAIADEDNLLLYPLKR